MLIEHIAISNFRVYHGMNEVQLATSPEGNITVIAGNNGFGKSSFLTALIWGLYGKLMVDVDERFRREVYEAGGYKKYCGKILNRQAAAAMASEYQHLESRLKSAKSPLERKEIKSSLDQLGSFQVGITIRDIFIPSVPCQEVEIRRTYNTSTHVEKVEVLMDGRANELTKSVGADIFINDFILPKEVAKFFFFDAERIVSLAEIKSIEEKRFFSKAYTEVLGIKKYLDLKENLENLRLRIRKKASTRGDQSKLAELEKKLERMERLNEHYEQDLATKREELAIRKSALQNFQEQLIREGSTLSMEELEHYRVLRENVSKDLATAKKKFQDLLELAPFAMVGSRLKEVQRQLENERQAEHATIAANLLETKYGELLAACKSKALDVSEGSVLDRILREKMLQAVEPQERLLDFSAQQEEQFLSLVQTMVQAYSKHFKRLVADIKRLQSTYTLAHKKIQQAEAKNKDEVVSTIRKRKAQAESQVQSAEQEIIQLEAKKINLQHEMKNLRKQVSEITKFARIEANDKEKDATAARLIGHLEKFVRKLRDEKKQSLQQSILRELHKLMHKEVVHQVQVTVEGDLMDINLLDSQGACLDKEGLSKGEQQLYATALLTALINESNIQFPVFVDSPLQKFDRQHARNIIQEFYPKVAGQVILFPLLEKELNEAEYQWLCPRVGKTYLIVQDEQHASSFAQVSPANLFNHYRKLVPSYV